MNIILTGERNQGKSTLCRKLAEALGDAGLRVGGVLTEKKEKNENVTLIAHNLLDQTTSILARTDWQIKGQKQGPFIFSPEGIYQGIRAIGHGLDADLLIIDEIGPLEMSKQGFYPALHAIRKAKQVLLVIRPSLIAHFMSELKLSDYFEIVILTQENRDQLLQQLLHEFLAKPAAELPN